MKRISLGGLDVSRIGLGTMAMSGYYLDADSRDTESIRTIQRALDLGVTLFDTAEIYGPFENEKLLGVALKGHRDEAVVATKFGLVSHAGAGPGVLDSSPANVRSAVEGSLKRLGTDRIDLYYQHRVDPNTPIEDTIGALAEGKVLHIGLSEAGPETIRRARAVHPVAALQTEYSLWTRDPEAELLPLLRELGIGFVPYSPLEHGFLTGTIRSPEQLSDDDWRKTNPRFAPGQLRAEPSHRRRGPGRRLRARRITGAGRVGLAACTGRRHRPDSRHQARVPRRGEHRRRRHRTGLRTDPTAQPSDPGHRRAPRGGGHGRHRPLTTSWGGAAARASITPTHGRHPMTPHFLLCGVAQRRPSVWTTDENQALVLLPWVR
jgi:aryl-alcohol dehydrogenase-like predicted oxidoreductase